MFGNKERDRRIKNLGVGQSDLNSKIFSLECEAPRVAALASTNQRDIDENEKAIALILQHLDLEYKVIPRHPELVPKETADAE